MTQDGPSNAGHQKREEPPAEGEQSAPYDIPDEGVLPSHEGQQAERVIHINAPMPCKPFHLVMTQRDLGISDNDGAKLALLASDLRLNEPWIREENIHSGFGEFSPFLIESYPEEEIRPDRLPELVKTEFMFGSLSMDVQSLLTTPNINNAVLSELYKQGVLYPDQAQLVNEKGVDDSGLYMCIRQLGYIRLTAERASEEIPADVIEDHLHDEFINLRAPYLAVMLLSDPSGDDPDFEGAKNMMRQDDGSVIVIERPKYSWLIFSCDQLHAVSEILKGSRLTLTCAFGFEN